MVKSNRFIDIIKDQFKEKLCYISNDGYRDFFYKFMYLPDTVGYKSIKETLQSSGLRNYSVFCIFENENKHFIKAQKKFVITLLNYNKNFSDCNRKLNKLRQYQCWLQFHYNISIENSGINEIDRYCRWLHQRKLYTNKQLTEIIQLVSFYFNDIIGIPFSIKEITIKIQKKKIPYIMTRNDVSQFFSMVAYFEYKLFFYILYTTHLTIREILEIKISDIDFTLNKILIIDQIHATCEYLTISPFIRDQIIKLINLENRSDDESLFCPEIPVPEGTEKIIQYFNQRISMARLHRDNDISSLQFSLLFISWPDEWIKILSKKVFE